MGHVSAGPDKTLVAAGLSEAQEDQREEEEDDAHEDEEPSAEADVALGLVRLSGVSWLGRRWGPGHAVPLPGPSDLRRLLLLGAVWDVRYLHGKGPGMAVAVPASMSRIRGLWSVLLDVDDPTLREDLAILAAALQVAFPDRGAREASVVEYMAIRFQWPATRTRRRLQSLVELGVLRCSRDLSDNWTKVFEVLDRPHVPPALAVEMGA